jgi:hypothetical protein
MVVGSGMPFHFQKWDKTIFLTPSDPLLHLRGRIVQYLVFFFLFFWYGVCLVHIVFFLQYATYKYFLNLDYWRDCIALDLQCSVQTTFRKTKILLNCSQSPATPFNDQLSNHFTVMLLDKYVPDVHFLYLMSKYVPDVHFLYLMSKYVPDVHFLYLMSKYATLY